MDGKCYIRENFKVGLGRNKLSGHEWTTHGPTTSWSVICPSGECSRHRTEAAAQKALVEWQGYYDRLNAQEGTT